MRRLSHKHSVQNAEKKAQDRSELALHVFRNRMRFATTVISFLFLMLAGRIIELNLYGADEINSRAPGAKSIDFILKRGDIVDRNGALLATNLSTASIFINAKEVIDPLVSAGKIHEVLPEISKRELENKFTSGKSFLWVKRHISPDEQQKIHDLGLPGLYFTNDERRIYPQSNLFSHLIGYVDLDSNGISGLEKQFDETLLVGKSAHENLQTSLDLRMQSIVKEELQKAVDLYEAVGASAIVMDATNGEIISLVSLPDFDPHHIQKSTERQRFNQATLGVYEMGSTMKLATVATALDTKAVSVHDAFDVSQPLRFANYTKYDYSRKNGSLTVPEVLIYSSNIGTAKIAERFGKQTQKRYINNFGMLSKVKLELPELSAPLYPKESMWNGVSLITISYGYGLSITPLHVVKAVAAMVNGGILYEPTLIKHNGKKASGVRVLSEETSITMRKLLRLIVEYGSGKRANVPGLYVGGKTGTSEILISGRYNKRANLGSFVGAFPMHNPKYAIIVLIDQAKPSELNGWKTTGGIVAAPVAGSIIKRASSILNIWPQNDEEMEISDKDLNLDFMPLDRPLVKVKGR